MEIGSQGAQSLLEKLQQQKKFGFEEKKIETVDLVGVSNWELCNYIKSQFNKNVFRRYIQISSQIWRKKKTLLNDYPSNEKDQRNTGF